MSRSQVPHDRRANHNVSLLVLLLMVATIVRVASASPITAGTTSDGARPRDERALAEVDAGRVTIARASWWGFDPKHAPLFRLNPVSPEEEGAND